MKTLGKISKSCKKCGKEMRLLAVTHTRSMIKDHYFCEGCGHKEVKIKVLEENN